MTVECTGEQVHKEHYDVVIVGAGWAGSLLAKNLSENGRRVLLMEAGEGGAQTWDGYLESVATFRSAVAKVPNSAYHRNAFAPSPDVLDLSPLRGLDKHRPHYSSNGYFEQKGELPYRTDYIRALGGSGMHWLGAVPRMLPEDFKTKTRFGYGRDWPIKAADLQPFYAAAERELGVAGNAKAQHALGAVSDPHYVYPMHEVPASHIDRHCRRIDKAKITDGMNVTRTLHVTGLPQARNSTPNPDYDGKKGYRPKGAVGLPNYGERCVGNASCVPICPVQAKSSPLRLQAASGEKVTLVTRSVVGRVIKRKGEAVKGKDERVEGVEYRTYTKDGASPAGKPYRVYADIVVLAAHAIENARLLLVSGLANRSGQVGRNLMDHPTTLAWALAESQVGPYRGPGHTSGWEEFRSGAERERRAPFRIEISNWGWAWATGAPMSNVAQALGVGGGSDGRVRSGGLFGPELRWALGNDIGRQLQLQIAVEQHADPENRVTIDRGSLDAMGNPRPVITYGLNDHVRDGVYAAYKASQNIFKGLHATEKTDHRPVEDLAPLGYFNHRNTDLTYQGAGHGAGTHIMGETAEDSVVDSYQKTHDHSNLYAVGCGSMPSIGTSNPTLTMAALALRSAEQIHRDLHDLRKKAAAGAKVKAAKEKR